MGKKKGVVKMYNSAKHYGFLRVLDDDGNPTGEERFFHYRDGQFLGHDGNRVVFIGHVKFGRPVRTERMLSTQYPNKRHIDAPVRGNILVFEEAPGRDGKPPKACPWGYADTYDSLTTYLEHRPVYRVILLERDGSPKETPETSIIAWEGQNLWALLLQYPLAHEGWFEGSRGSYSHNVPDALAPHASTDLENPWYMCHYTFGVLREGKWLQADDPRVPLSDVPRWACFEGMHPDAHVEFDV